jgi:hypothetical protein
VCVVKLQDWYMEQVLERGRGDHRSSQGWERGSGLYGKEEGLKVEALMHWMAAAYVE